MAQFRASLEEFNKRREYIIDQNGKPILDGYQDFLKYKFDLFYNDDFIDVTKLNPELFLGSKEDFEFLNIVFTNIHSFDLSTL